MNIMQYEITLPADYDMGIIRNRVATRGNATDAFPGLGLKAYGIRERGREGSSANQYAPFYLWVSTRGMNDFLWGDGFRGLSRDFGRPVVRQWTGLAFMRGRSASTTPRAASRHAERIPTDADPAASVDVAFEELRRLTGVPGVHSAALAVDTRCWELVRFALLERPNLEAVGTRYEVLETV